MTELYTIVKTVEHTLIELCAVVKILILMLIIKTHSNLCSLVRQLDALGL